MENLPLFHASFFQVLALLALIAAFGISFYSAQWRLSPSAIAPIMFKTSSSLLLIIVALNVVVDPYNQLNLKILPPNTLPMRHQKPELLVALAIKPQVLIMGSSTSMNLDPQEIENACGLPAFNGGVFSAAAEDHIAMTRFTLAQSTLSHLVLGLDLSALEDQYTYGGNLIYTPLKDYIVLPWSQKLIIYRETFSTFVSAASTEESISFLRLYFADHAPPPRYVLAENGLLVYLQSEQVAFPAPIATEATPQSNLVANGNYFDAQRQAALVELIADVSAQGVRVIIFLPPIHQFELARQSTDPKSQRQYVEGVALLEQLRQDYGIIWHDFRSVTAFGGVHDAFHDFTHMNEVNAHLLMAALIPDICDAL